MISDRRRHAGIVFLSYVYTVSPIEHVRGVRNREFYSHHFLLLHDEVFTKSDKFSTQTLICRVCVGKIRRSKLHLHTNKVVTNIQSVQLKSGLYFNMSNLFTKIYNMLYYTTNLYLQ